jgi:hypothetical protein
VAGRCCALVVQLQRMDQLLEHRKLVFRGRTGSERFGTTRMPSGIDDSVDRAVKPLLQAFWALHGRGEDAKSAPLNP